MTNEEVVRSYTRAAVEGDLAAMAKLRHKDWTVDWPQSGERVRGSEAFAAINEQYPGGRPHEVLSRVIGTNDRWVMSPSNTVVRVVGEGEAWRHSGCT